MITRQFYILFLLLHLFYISTYAQDITVKSFVLSENTISANIQGPNRRIDQNGEVAALIKVRTTEKGFIFYGGLLGIVDTKQDVGEIYVWVPRGAKQIEIKHERYGVLNYWYPREIPIESGRTYEMILETKTPPRVDTEYLIMQVTPAHADVYVDDTLQSVFKGRLIKKLLVGTHRYMVKCYDFETITDTFVLYKEGPTELNIDLSPTKGEVLITSKVPGTRIYVNGIFHGIAPYRFQGIEGKYEVRADATGYNDKTKTVWLYGGNTDGVTKFRLTPSYVPENKWIWYMMNYSVYLPTNVSEIGTTLTYMRGLSSFIFMGAGISVNWNWEKKTAEELTDMDKYNLEFIESEFDYRSSRISVPIYAAMRLYPAGYGRQKTKFFLDARLGFSLCFDYLIQKDIFRTGTFSGAYNTGFYLSPSLGIERRWLGIGENGWELSIAYERNGLINMKIPYYYKGLDTFDKLSRAISFRFGFVF